MNVAAASAGGKAEMVEDAAFKVSKLSEVVSMDDDDDNDDEGWKPDVAGMARSRSSAPMVI